MIALPDPFQSTRIVGSLTLCHSDASKINVWRLIDVHERAIKRFSGADGVRIADYRYVALSYVWGKVPQRMMLLRSNWHVLKEPGALRPEAVSKTINDAIILTGMLGFRYLWVDALCILQDNPLVDKTNDKATHLTFMSQIYMHAELVIIAASGLDAEAGLQGLSGTRNASQQIIKVPSSTPELPALHLMTAATIRPLWGLNFLHNTKWTTRGWTLQELALSRRTLIFTETQVYWRCRQAHWAEDTLTETRLATCSLRGFGNPPFLDLTGHLDSEKTWNQLRAQIAEYSTRELTGEGDAHDAFSAVLQEFTRVTKEPFLWALPTSRFELGLCWTRHVQTKNGGADGSPLKRRTDVTTLPVTALKKQVHFPSWSWLGWAGSIEPRFTDLYIETG